MHALPMQATQHATGVMDIRRPSSPHFPGRAPMRMISSAASVADSSTCALTYTAGAQCTPFKLLSYKQLHTI